MVKGRQGRDGNIGDKRDENKMQEKGKVSVRDRYWVSFGSYRIHSFSNWNVDFEHFKT